MRPVPCSLSLPGGRSYHVFLIESGLTRHTLAVEDRVDRSGPFRFTGPGNGVGPDHYHVSTDCCSVAFVPLHEDMLLEGQWHSQYGSG